MNIKKLTAVLLITTCMILTACGGGGGTPAAEPDPETAMNNFLAKVDAGNYVLDAPEFLKITVSSADQVAFEYADDAYSDFAVVSVNGEAFRGMLTGEELTEVDFLGEGRAVDAAKDRLLNYWMDESVSDGNIWNLFYNDPEDPLRFSSHDETVMRSLISFVGYSENALRLMHDVYLVLDKEDPDSARLQCEVDEDLVARVNYDDIDLEVTFGNAESNAAADAWMSAPAYPEARTGWTETDEFIFNSVFLVGYGLEAVPFPEFASYALKLDQENFVFNDEVSIRDSHATEKDMADYAELLKQSGFAEVTDKAEDGTERTYYRKLLREDYKCYSSIALDYDGGVDITAKKYYDFPTYGDLDAINGVITKAGYPALPGSDNFTAYMATDRADEMTESWIYFFDYDLGLYVDIDYDDRDAAEAYIKDYEKALSDAGFTTTGSYEEYEDAEAEAASDESDESDLFTARLGEAAEDESEIYESENGFANFRYKFTDDGRVTLLFKAQRYIPASDAAERIAEAGFPKIGLTEPIACRDLRMFRKERYGYDEKAFITVSQEYESAEAAEAFLTAYEAALNELGFDRVNPENVGSLKQIAIANEEKGMFVALDYFPEQAAVYFEFCAE